MGCRAWFIDQLPPLPRPTRSPTGSGEVTGDRRGGCGTAAEDMPKNKALRGAGLWVAGWGGAGAMIGVFPEILLGGRRSWEVKAES